MDGAPPAGDPRVNTIRPMLDYIRARNAVDAETPPRDDYAQHAIDAT